MVPRCCIASIRVLEQLYCLSSRLYDVYGAETWAESIVQEKKLVLDLAEMTMLRWVCVVTKLERIRNEINNWTDTESGGNLHECTIHMLNTGAD